MSVCQFLDVVPKSVKTVAAVIAGGGLLFGLALTVGWIDGKAIIAGPFLGLLAGVVIAIWILGVGYVNADARRRGMPTHRPREAAAKARLIEVRLSTTRPPPVHSRTPLGETGHTIPFLGSCENPQAV